MLRPLLPPPGIKAWMSFKSSESWSHCVQASCLGLLVSLDPTSESQSKPQAPSQAAAGLAGPGPQASLAAAALRSTVTGSLCHPCGCSVAGRCQAPGSHCDREIQCPAPLADSGC
jgi:hypothetical protein